LLPTLEGRSKHFEIFQSFLFSLLKETTPQESNQFRFCQIWTDLGKGKYSFPAPYSLSVSPKGKAASSSMKVTSQGHRLTKRMRTNHRSIECFGPLSTLSHHQ
jgi:hypothetical protein